MHIDALYRAIVETSPDAIWVTDLDGSTLFANPTMAELFGVPSAHDMQGVTMFDTLDDLGKQQYAAHLERRKTSLEKAGHRILAAWRREQKRADHLQQRLDDAVGLSTTIVDSGRWQPGYKPAPKPEVAS